MASTSSSSVTASPSSTQGWTYDVFLSFRGPYIRKTFIDYLYSSLERKEIRTFKDDDRMDKGDCISPALTKAIQESKFLIPVFSKTYASSKWCLDELATIMDCHGNLKGQIVVPIFYHVEPSDVRNQKESFGDSFKELLEKNFKNDQEVQEKVRRWKEALKMAGELKGHHWKNDYNGSEATCAEKVVDDIFARLNQASLAFEENLVGLESRVENIGNWLKLTDDDDDAARFIGICGMGGIGKTTIAMAIFNRFSYQFGGACFLAGVRQHNVIELQKTLIAEILKEKSAVQISHVQDRMWNRLGRKKVLIVLDDVDNVEQLQKLAGVDWFGKGSRVIITTRDAGVLRSHGVDEKYMYEVQTLGEQEAIQLFSLFAFKNKKEPEPGVKQLSGLIVSHAMGLPLALKLLGSHLCGKDADNWKTILVELEKKDSLHAPKYKIDEVLRISFDGLDPDNKNVFLDITCFFRNWRQEYVKGVLDSDLRELIDKSLISVQDGRIEMHDLIEEMGWHIASKEEPRSRVWKREYVDGDGDDVLSRAIMDPKHREAIRFVRWWSNENTFEISFGGMRTLKMFKVGGRDNVLRVIDNYLPSSLRWLEFESYHFTSLPESFAPSELVGLSLRKSSLENWRITQTLGKLTLLDLSSSSSLLATPDFDWMPNLMRLNLGLCGNLKEVHPSIGNLSKLVLLDLNCCGNLKLLPSFNQVSSLSSLDLCGCVELNSFPEIKAGMPHLVELYLIKVGIKELPSSIQQLHDLTKLCLDECERLVCLCDDLCELKNLKVLVINNCTKLKSLPKNFKGLISLEYLNLNGSYFFSSLPESFNQFPRLQYLDIRNCKNLKELPELPKTLKELYADPHFVFRGNIADLAKECSELHSLAFSFDDHKSRTLYFSPEMCIDFPNDRKAPFSVYSPRRSLDEVPIDVLRLFQYRCYKSNGISIDLKPFRYCQSFVGFVVYFLSSSRSRYDIWGEHSYRDIGDVMHCTIIVKLSHKDNGNEVLSKKCVIVKPYEDNDEIKGDICFVYIPFSSLWPAKSNTNINGVTLNDFSRFEVNFMKLEAAADWGCSLLYKRKKRPASWDDSRPRHTTDTGPLGMLEYLNLSGEVFKHLLPEDISRLRRLQYIDISDCPRLGELPELPATIRELYAAYNQSLASKSNITELATKYSELYSVSFSSPINDYPASLVPGELATEFIPITQPFLNRNTPFAVTYPISEPGDYNISGCFKYPHHDPHLHDPHKISISLDPTWYSHNFVGFVVCFVFPFDVRWKSHPNSLPFRYCKLITKLTHKDNGSDHEPPLKTECVIGRLYDEEFNDLEDELVCFAYIPFSSLWPKSKAITDITIPNHYLVFEAVIQDLESSENFDLENSTDWSCGLLYTDDESLTEAIQQKREAGFSESHSGIGSKTEEETEEEEEEEEEEDEDGGSQHTEDIGGDDALAEDSNPEDEEKEEDGGSQLIEDSSGDDAMAEDSNSGMSDLDARRREAVRRKAYKAAALAGGKGKQKVVEEDPKAARAAAVAEILDRPVLPPVGVTIGCSPLGAAAEAATKLAREKRKKGAEEGAQKKSRPSAHDQPYQIVVDGTMGTSLVEKNFDPLDWGIKVIWPADRRPLEGVADRDLRARAALHMYQALSIDMELHHRSWSREQEMADLSAKVAALNQKLEQIGVQAANHSERAEKAEGDLATALAAVENLQMAVAVAGPKAVAEYHASSKFKSDARAEVERELAVWAEVAKAWGATDEGIDFSAELGVRDFNDGRRNMQAEIYALLRAHGPEFDPVALGLPAMVPGPGDEDAEGEAAAEAPGEQVKGDIPLDHAYLDSAANLQSLAGQETSLSIPEEQVGGSEREEGRREGESAPQGPA